MIVRPSRFLDDLTIEVFTAMGLIFYWINNVCVFPITQILPPCTEPEQSTRVNLTAS